MQNNPQNTMSIAYNPKYESLVKQHLALTGAFISQVGVVEKLREEIEELNTMLDRQQQQLTKLVADTTLPAEAGLPEVPAKKKKGKKPTETSEIPTESGTK